MLALLLLLGLPSVYRLAATRCDSIPLLVSDSECGGRECGGRLNSGDSDGK